MSAEQRGPDFTTPADERIRTRDPDPTTDSRSLDASPLHRSAGDSSSTEPSLSYQIERTQLRARIAVLEHALRTSEDRRQAVIEQYERLLADRDDANDRQSLSEPPTRSRSYLTRLIDRIRSR
ncbi:hypothetical protein [Natrinema caseinilyticum]|uniref:hypothetical protein n=1 Tax=Natrinema caseinilyticum TaxID=2961570 RepID=UPI0020C4CA75|nr:hypothetical protein [Natrinema caseinilyticum]